MRRACDAGVRNTAIQLLQELASHSKSLFSSVSRPRLIIFTEDIQPTIRSNETAGAVIFQLYLDVTNCPDS